jgi:hypothetical protein
MNEFMIQKICHLIQGQWHWFKKWLYFESAWSWTNSWWNKQYQKTKSNHNKKETRKMKIITTSPNNSFTHSEEIVRVNQPQAAPAKNTTSFMNLKGRIRLHEPQAAPLKDETTWATISFEEFNKKLIHLLECMKDLSSTNRKFREFFLNNDVLDIDWPKDLSPTEKMEQYEQCYSKVIELDINDYWEFPDPDYFQRMIYRGPDVPRIFKSDKRIQKASSIKQGSPTPGTSNAHDYGPPTHDPPHWDFLILIPRLILTRFL